MFSKMYFLLFIGCVSAKLLKCIILGSLHMGTEPWPSPTFAIFLAKGKS